MLHSQSWDAESGCCDAAQPLAHAGYLWVQFLLKIGDSISCPVHSAFQDHDKPWLPKVSPSSLEAVLIQAAGQLLFGKCWISLCQPVVLSGLGIQPLTLYSVPLLFPCHEPQTPSLRPGSGSGGAQSDKRTLLGVEAQRLSLGSQRLRTGLLFKPFVPDGDISRTPQCPFPLSLSLSYTKK